MNCPQCQKVLAENTRFCSRCGLPVGAATKQTLIAAARDTDEGSRPSDPLIGKVLDEKYELVARLGSGATGTVYRARRLHIGDEVAVKILSGDYVLAESAMERFRREARSAAMIRHPNVVAIHDFAEGKPGTPAYIVMELVRGASLRELLQQEGHLSSERAVALMRDVCAGVGVAHQHGVVHRDLKPDNIIVARPEYEGDRETAKVVDFGVAKLRDTTADFKLTQTGSLVGTPFYMSPEQLHGQTLDARSDVYSLGAMLYEMLAGNPPFNASSLPELITRQLHSEPPSFERSLSVPPALEQLCRRAMAKSPGERPPDAGAFGRELQTALTSSASVSESLPSQSQIAMPGALTDLSKTAPPLNKRRSHTGVWIAAGIVALVIVGGAIAAIFTARSFIGSHDSGNANANLSSPPVTTRETGPTKQTSADENNNSSAPTGVLDGTSLLGQWTGTYGPSNDPATLLVKEYKDGIFSGVLEQGQVRVAFTGSINLKDRHLTMKQTKVLAGSGWSLGEDSGEISSDGKKISGTGQDSMGGQFGLTYQWSFSK